MKRPLFVPIISFKLILNGEEIKMSNKETAVVLFNEKSIRRAWHEEAWWFSVIDVVGALTESLNARDYWFKMKTRVKSEDGIELSTICRQLKLVADDGKMRETDCANTEGILRIIQSIPSTKAEPFKQWLAKVGYERMQEMADPARSLDRARETWQQHGYSEKWIQQRMMGQETRNKLTDYWKENGVQQPDEFAILTNVIHKEWTGMGVKEHKKAKGLKSQNLRDHMSEAELIFTALAELSTRQIAETMQAQGMDENKIAGKTGGSIAKKARLELETKTGKKVVSSGNYLSSKKNLTYRD